MPTRTYVNPRDLSFWLYDLPPPGDGPPAAGFAREDFTAMLDAATRLADDAFEGLAEVLDAHEPRLDGDTVWNHERLAPALKAYLDSGFFSAPFPARWGGSDMPFAIAQALNVPVMALGGTGTGYLFLTAAAANMLRVVGSPAQQETFLPPMVSGRWFGTMMLSETQAGSSVGDIRTRAVPQADGTYHLTGSKMWISGGDQEMSENIVHMVLAKIDAGDGRGVGAGSGGVSLFLVPKFLVEADGSLGARNGIRVAGVNHKMGHRGIVNTVPVLGENTPCVGYLLGAPGKGLAAMFHMMNEARIGVGLGAAQLGYFAYRYALNYARERLQGRPHGVTDPAHPPVAIVEHADVRRMLLEQKALAEGAMALGFYAAQLVDARNAAPDEATRQAHERLLAILTPIVKSWPSVWGLHANYLAIQVLGGYGYTRDFPLERLYRDNRLNEIHEGTTGIQSLDLLGRKVGQEGGAALELLLAKMSETAREAASVAALGEHAAALGQAIARLRETTAVLVAQKTAGRADRMLADSALYLEMGGHTVVAWMWLRTALAAERLLPAAGPEETAYLRGKLRACRFFFRRWLPRTAAQAALLQSLDDTGLAAPVDEL